MSCEAGKPCAEGIKRRRALIMLGLMMLVFIVLSGFSFLSERGQVTPGQVSFDGHPATAGKRVFQTYNCMDCHTVVGNGAYFAPDLTKEYEAAGPAWLAAFLPSAGGWPTEAALRVQLANPAIAKDAGVDTLDAYYAKFPGAKARVARRHGATTMPNLPFRSDEVPELIAYLKYTSALDTEGWPPKVETGDLAHRVALLHGERAVAAAPAVAAAVPAATGDAGDLAAKGRQLATDLGCAACHAATDAKLVGPGWGGLYGSTVTLDGGATVKADDAYLIQSIRDPNAKIVAGFPASVMPVYDEKLVSDDDVKALVAYIHSLEKP